MIYTWFVIVPSLFHLRHVWQLPRTLAACRFCKSYRLCFAEMVRNPTSVPHSRPSFTLGVTDAQVCDQSVNQPHACFQFQWFAFSIHSESSPEYAFAERSCDVHGTGFRTRGGDSRRCQALSSLCILLARNQRSIKTPSTKAVQNVPGFDA